MVRGGPLDTRRDAGADVEETEWNVRKRAEMATEHPQATVRSLVNGTGFGSVAAAGVPPFATRAHKETDDR